MCRFLTLTMILSFGITARAAAEAEKLDLEVDGVERSALVHFPAEAKNRPAPVVFVFHGHGQTMDDAANQFAIEKHWEDPIVVYMQGLHTKAGNDPQGKQSGWQYNVGENKDRDVKFFDAVLADLRKNYKVDDKRVYAVGFSNGGGFAFVLWSARGDQVKAVVSCAMHANEKLLSTFKAKPLLQIAGKNDDLQPVAVQKQTVLAVAGLNDCGEMRPWGKKAGCTIYPSNTDNPVVFFVHSGGHEVPKEAPSRIVEFLRKTIFESPVVGDWHMNQPTVGESNLQITEKAGKLEVEESGNGNAKSTKTSYKDGLLVIYWEVSEDLRGYWVLKLNQELTKGNGKTVFTRFKDFEPGEPREIDGQKVRVVEGVTMECIGEKNR